MSRQQHSPRQSSVQFRRGAKALVTVADRILLVKESHADGSTFWTLPGGGLESDESPLAALHRELSEELHCRAAVGEQRAKLWYAHASPQRTVTRYAVFECALLSRPVPNGADGVLDVQWRRESYLPPNTLLPIRYLVETELCPRASQTTTTTVADRQTNESK
jgi:8-oxo-dGTP diphosphatase